MAVIRIDIWRGDEPDDEPKAGVRLSIKEKDQIEFHSRDRAYIVEFETGNPFEGDPTFDIGAESHQLSPKLKGSQQAEGEYKFRVIDKTNGKILDPTIFVDP